jgi:hypothetical protein
MTVKLLHFTARKRGAYYDNVDIEQIVKLTTPKIWVFDFCAMFMFLAKSGRFASRLLYARFIDGGMFVRIVSFGNARG